MCTLKERRSKHVIWLVLRFDEHTQCSDLNVKYPQWA